MEYSAWRALTVSTPVRQCACQHSHTVTAIASPLWVLPDTQSGSGEEEHGQVAASGGVRVSPMAAVPNCHNAMALDAIHASLGQKPTMAWLGPLPGLKWRCQLAACSSGAPSPLPSSFLSLARRQGPVDVTVGALLSAGDLSQLLEATAPSPREQPSHQQGLRFLPTPAIPPTWPSATGGRKRFVCKGPGDQIRPT